MIARILRSRTVWIVFFVAFIAVFVMATVSHAQGQSETEQAKKYNVTFPVAELGNCGSIAECRTFCEDPVNQNTCIAFAKKKGFYKEPEITTSKKDELVAAAKKELGCDSESSCRALCSDQVNFDKCDTFAKKRGLNGGRVEDPGKAKILEKAKAILGCNSPSSCSLFCSKEENRQKCSEFAKEAGLRGGEQRVGPGGCTSEETCKTFCSDPQNFQICRGFTQSSGGDFSGPGGCNSEQSCRAYCRDHENECRSLGGPGGSPPPGYNPQEMCSRTPNCKWEENTCKCGFYGGSGEEGKRAEEYAKFCSENPDRCRLGQTGGFNSEKERQEFENYCRQNPDKCRSQDNSGGNAGGSMSRESQEATCKAGGGTCDWNNGICNCRGYNAPSGGYYNGRYESPEEACKKGGGCTWTGNNCQCPTSATTTTTNTTSNTAAPPGMSRDSQEAGCRSCGGTCSWSGDFCNCHCQTSGSAAPGIPQPVAPASTSAPVPAQTSAPQPTTSSQIPPPSTTTSTPAPSAAVNGIFVVRSILDRLLDFFR